MVEYFPILKWKKGEQIALSNLRVAENQMMPVIQIIDNVEPSLFFQELKTCFSGPIYFDTTNCAKEGDSKSILHELIYYAKENNISAYPILKYGDLEDCHHKFEKCGIYVPVPDNFDGDSFENIINKLNSYASTIKIDLFLDAGLIKTQQESNLIFPIYKSNLGTLSKYSNFNKLIICLTSFPDSLTALGSGETRDYERYDIEIFNKLREQDDLISIKEKLHYADYGVTKYTESDIDFSKLSNRILPKVKYTVQDKYVVIKGSNRPHQITYIDLAQKVVESNYYYGKNFSYGDEEIYNKAQGTSNIGNNTNWVTYCCNHHIAAVLEQLSKNF